MSGENQNQDRLKKIFEELDRPTGLSELPRRIELCRQALAMISRETQSELWAMLQDDLASCLAQTSMGSRVENLEQAIHHFKLALEVRTRQRYPTEWASTQNNLATAYRERIRGERAENIEWAIDLYRQALQVRIRSAFPLEWAMTQNSLAGVYYLRIRGERSENLERAIQYFEQVLEVRTRHGPPQDLASTQNDLATAYRERIRGERAENIEKSIQYYEQALDARTRAADPERWALTQNNLGNAYCKRIRGVRAESIELAIYHCRQALEVYTRHAFPHDWASVQDNLGNAYRYRIRGDRLQNIEQAIYHCQQALTVRTRQALPNDWAQTQNNLGNAYRYRLRGDREQSIEQAIHQYKQALEVYTEQKYPEDWAQVQNNLGNAYRARIRGKPAENNEESIRSYQNAMKVRTRDAYPEDWAETLSNLAGTERIRDGAAKNIEQAIQHLEQVLEVYTRDAFPREWARTHNNLGMVYTDRKQGERAQNIELAIRHFQLALEVYTPEAFSERCLKTARGLGILAFDDRRWEIARDAYDTALSAQEALLQASFSPASEKVELGEVQNLPARAAYAHVKLGNVERAIEVLEKGRAQLLRESYEYQKQNLEQLRALGFNKLYEEYMQARDEYQALQNIEMSKHAGLADWKPALEKVQAATLAIRNELGGKHPQYRHFLQALSFDEIQEQARAKPLVYLCATSAGGLALVVSKQGVQAIEIPELDQESIQKQIWRPSNEEIDRINVHLQMGMITLEDIQAVSGGYFSMYALWSLIPSQPRIRLSKEMVGKLFEAWQETLDSTTHWLWEVVMGKLISVLKEHHESITLLPAAQLALLPLHAAWTEDSSKPTRRRYALDEINIGYAPSAHALWQASLAVERPAMSLMIVDNPDGTLHYSKGEVQAALDVFKQATYLPGKKATLSMVKDEMQKAHVLHFSTHGRAGWEKAEQARLKMADGELTLPDIFTLDLHQARLAVLSACETGVPGLELIDEMIGLPAGLMQAGVPGVVGSLWSVSDMSTAMLMARFYSSLREGCAPQEALRQSQIWLRDSTTVQKKELFERFMDGQIVGMGAEAAQAFYEYIEWKKPDARIFASPFYWAAFTYTGI